VARAGRDGTAPTGALARLRASLPDVGRSRNRRDPGPRVAFTREDARRLNERFALLGRAERRAIVRAVNRGDAMPKRRDAELAIGVARRQQRFWSRAWLLGPAIAVVQVLVTPIGWMEGLLLGAWGAVLLGMMAAWWWTRARRAELKNLEVIGPRGLRDRPTEVRRTTGQQSRLPGRRTSTAPDGAEGAPGSADDMGPSMARPPRPRGRKRR
jgi:hypothetical protein